MQVVVTLEQRFQRTPDGTVWTPGPFPYPFWQRYLAVFDGVRAVARVEEVVAAPDGWKAATGDRVAFAAVPYYVGPRQYAMKYGAVHRAIRASVQWGDAVILRVGSAIAATLLPMLQHAGYPYAVEVVSDPEDVFAPGAIKHPARAYFRWHFPRKQREVCAGAIAALYVTREALQRRYPCPGYRVGISDVELPPAALVDAPRPAQSIEGRARVIYVGTLAQMYKAPDVLIKAIARCVAQGLDVELVMVGEGRHRAELADLAAKLGIGERVQFTGQLPGADAVRAALDQAHLFVLPSYQEGLPRAMVEAMARGLPCIGSHVGGIPELLPPADMVPPGQVEPLAAAIAAVLRDPERMARMSARNLATSHTFVDDALDEQRTAFYTYIREQTESHLMQRIFA